MLLGVPNRDMLGVEFRQLPPDVRMSMLNSGYYVECDDEDVVLAPSYRLDRAKCKNVLAFTPTRSNGVGFESRSRESLFSLKWTYGFLDWFVTRDNPSNVGAENILHQLNKAHDVLEMDGYDALLIVESDMIVPSNALERLARLEGDVCGGIYVLRHDSNELSAFPYVPLETSPGMNIRTMDLISQWGNVIRTNGVCFGCTLIHRDVLERIPFRLTDHGAPSVDWAFMEDCNKSGMTTLCDLSVICGHVESDGMTLWPSLDGVRKFGVRKFMEF